MPERKKTKPKTFEETLTRLDEIVRSLEKGDAPLDESLALYTEGAELVRSCTKQLDEAEQTVVRLQKGEDGTPTEVPFIPENDSHGV
jgi:exodeoxyribonuclease VII small subunit